MTDRVSEAGSYLRAWHAEHTGATGQVLSDLVDEQGRSSYDVVAATTQGAATILDLACGDGLLLERFDPRRLSVGVDRSPHELTAARRRGGASVPLLCANAGRLPLRSRSVDHVTCHLALMLLQPLEAVLSEIARVLQPEGRFVAALPAIPDGSQPGVWSALRTSVAVAVGSDRFDPPPLQDPRALDKEALAALLDVTGFHGTASTTIEFARDVPIDSARSRLSLTYLPDLLSTPQRERFDAALTENLAQCAGADGRVRFVQPLEIIVSTRSAE